MKEELVEWQWCGLPYNAYDAKSGARVVEIHYSADPEKDQKWASELRRTAAIPTEQWQREMELDVSIHDGVPVFPEYQGKLHCPTKQSLGLVPDAPLIMGWDCGVGLATAAVLLQIEPQYHQFQVLCEILSAPNEPMILFAPRVAHEMRQFLGTGLWARVQHVGDPAGAAKTGTTGKSAYQIAYDEARINIKRSTNNWEDRRGAVSWALSDLLDESTPRWVLDPVRCPILRRGFEGKYELRTNRDESGPSAVWKPVPLKNSYSHIQDAHQYAVMEARKTIDRLTRNAVTRANTPVFADLPASVLRSYKLRRRSG